MSRPPHRSKSLAVWCPQISDRDPSTSMPPTLPASFQRLLRALGQGWLAASLWFWTRGAKHRVVAGSVTCLCRRWGRSAYGVGSLQVLGE